MKRILSMACMSLLVASSIVVSAQAPTRGNVAILLDLSGSMNAELNGESRRDVAVEALTETIGEIDGNASTALYAFGNNFDNSPSSKAQSCEDINQLVDFNKNNSGAIKDVLSGLEAKGWTPLAKSITMIGDDLSQFGDSEHHLIILSDGEESCNGDPVAAVEALKANGVNVIVNTIGLDVDTSTRTQLEAIATAGGGQYFDAADAGALTKSLENVIEKEVAEPQADADFSAEFVMPMGGSSFEDAVELSMDYFDGEAYSFPKHLEAGKYFTYKLDEDFLAKDPEFVVGGILADSVVFGEDGAVTVNEGDSYSSIRFDFFDKRKANIDSGLATGAANEVTENQISLVGKDEVYLFVGDDDEGFNKDNKIFFEYEELETETDQDTEVEDMDADSDSGDSLDIDVEVDEDSDESFMDQETLGVQNLYLLIGFVGLLLVLTLVMVLAMRKKK